MVDSVTNAVCITSVLLALFPPVFPFWTQNFKSWLLQSLEKVASGKGFYLNSESLETRHIFAIAVQWKQTRSLFQYSQELLITLVIAVYSRYPVFLFFLAIWNQNGSTSEHSAGDKSMKTKWKSTGSQRGGYNEMKTLRHHSAI